MTKKDYLNIIDALMPMDGSRCVTKKGWARLADLFKRDNPNFDRDRFMKRVAQRMRNEREMHILTQEVK